jgi:hypothetical protein
MAMQISDVGAGSKLLSASNGGGVDLGSGTAGTTLSIQGRNLLDGSQLAANTLPSGGVARVVGSVTITSLSSVTVTVGPCAGMGTISPAPARLVRFDGTQFTAALLTSTANVTQACAYAII